MTILIAPIVCLVMAVLINQFLNKRNNGRKHLVLGIKSLEHVKKVMTLCQQHRGISNAVLQGNSVLKHQLVAIQSSIDELIKQGEQFKLSQFSQWQSFSEHWLRLKKHSLDGDLALANLIRQHKIMIEGHLSLSDEIVMFYGLHTIMVDSSSRMSGLCQDTLRLVETIAQARGIGSGACAKGECSGVDRISLNFLRISLKADVEPLLNELKKLDNTALSERLTQPSNRVENTIDDLNKVLDTLVLTEGKTKIEANDYFKVATQPIDHLLNIFDIILAFGQNKYN